MGELFIGLFIFFLFAFAWGFGQDLGAASAEALIATIVIGIAGAAGDG